MNQTKILSLLWLFLPFLGEASDNDAKSIEWYDFNAAQQLIVENPRPIFIEFTAKWCGWCKKMEKTTFIDDAVVKLLNDQFYPVKVDFDDTTPINFQGNEYTGKELAKHFGISGLPTMIYISSDQNGNATIVGYKTAKQLIKELYKLNQP